MLESISFPVNAQSMAEYEDAGELLRACRALGCDGVEAIWGGDAVIDALPAAVVTGYHLLFYADWLDFWRGDEQALLRKFGSWEAVVAFYGGEDRRALLAQYRADLDRAKRLGARYVVLHVSDVSIEEGYTYRWLHTDRDVLDAAIELANLLFSGERYSFALLLENQWWPGFTFTSPQQTAYLLDGICYPNKGILLDTGHLMNTNPSLRTQRDGLAYLQQKLDEHGDLKRYIRGVHLHQSCSGAYVRAHTGYLPKSLQGEYMDRFREGYKHILQIDCHQPWTQPEIASLVARISPEFLTHELACANRAERERAVAVQKETLWKGAQCGCR